MENSEQLKPTKKRITQTSTKADKREMMLFRNTGLVLGCILFGSLLTTYHYDDSIKNKSESLNNLINKNIELNKQNNKLSNLLKTKSENDININFLYVIKTSEIFNIKTKSKKYFISYRKYKNKNEYQNIIREIDFNTYMIINSQDKLNINFFN